jgi:hypothetical protein
MNNPLLSVRTDTDLDALRYSIAGDVFGPGDEGYDEARRAFNLALDLRPAVIAFAESAIDVVKIVRFAREAGLRVAPQGTSHGASALEGLEDAILLKTSPMRRVDIYPSTRTARVEAGAEWQDVTVPAAEHGLAALAGSAPDVGVVGYTLGGGIGWLARRYGLSAGSVTAVEIATPDGRLVRADADNEPDLFWAVRGGGGSVGVVTALEIALYPVREVYAGALFFPIERSSEVLHAWREWIDTVPDELTSVGRIMQFPPIPDAPERVRGKSFALVEAAYLGDEFEGAELIRPLRELGPVMDTFGMIPAPALQHLAHGPAGARAPRGRRHVPRRCPDRGDRRDGGSGRPRLGLAAPQRGAASPGRRPDGGCSPRRRAGEDRRALRDVRRAHGGHPRDRRGGGLARASGEGHPRPVARRVRLLQLRRQLGGGRRGPSARLVPPPASGQGEVRPCRDDRLGSPGPPGQVGTLGATTRASRRRSRR